MGAGLSDSAEALLSRVVNQLALIGTKLDQVTEAVSLLTDSVRIADQRLSVVEQVLDGIADGLGEEASERDERLIAAMELVAERLEAHAP
jgi:hypothetical protein